MQEDYYEPKLRFVSLLRIQLQELDSQADKMCQSATVRPELKLGLATVCFLFGHIHVRISYSLILSFIFLNPSVYLYRKYL